MANPMCTRSNQAAPTPKVARKPESTSSVVICFISTPGKRYVTPVTMAPKRTRNVARARKPSVVYASSIGSSTSPTVGI
jgi:hypothetical protein